LRSVKRAFDHLLLRYTSRSRSLSSCFVE
jgi:hypothetical protein